MTTRGGNKNFHLMQSIFMSLAPVFNSLAHMCHTFWVHITPTFLSLCSLCVFYKKTIDFIN